ncbi:MAG: CoA transferase, partial [Dehalococcoidia bacterium]|nr:CoA transferase [Dehalococcoidia bacterium]
ARARRVPDHARGIAMIPASLTPWTDGALSGYRILDYTTAWAGTRLTTYLAEMGAEVIHVESIQYLDTHRGWSKWAVAATGNMPDNDPGARPWERNSQYNEFNKGKLGLTLDLGDPRGVALFTRLAAISDVVVDNYKAGTVDRFGIGYAALKAVRPDIICVSLPAFGTSGPYRSFIAWGNQVMAIAGHGLLLNYEGEDEPEPSGTYADPIAAIAGAFAVAAALFHRERTGQGQYLELALAEVMPGFIPEAIADYALNGRVARAIGNRNPAAAPWGVYPCAGDDDWIAICCQTDDDFVNLCAVMERPDLLHDPRFGTMADRVAHHAALDAIIADWTRPQNRHALADRLQAVGVAAEAAAQLRDVLADPQLEARGFFQPLTHPDAGTHRYPLQAVRLSRTPPRARRPAPTYGQHNVEVLTGLLGLSADELAELAAAQVIGTEPLEDDVRRRRGRSGGQSPA